MPASFILTLDTLGPAGVTLALDDGAAFTPDVNVVAAVGTTDADTTGYQMKVWGDVAGAADEAAAAWVAYNQALPVTLSAGDGLKTVSVRLRDDVGNTSAVVTDTITLDTTAPVPTITVAAAPTKISKVAGFDTSTFTFAADNDIVAWKVKVVPAANSPESAGTTIPVAGGSTNTTGGAKAAGVGQQVTIKGADLEAASAGDGDKIVKVFVQDGAGFWST